MAEVWFRFPVDNLLGRGLADVSTPALTDALRAGGAWSSRGGYPVETFVRLLEIAGRVVAPNEAPFDQQRAMGRRFVRAWFDHPIGEALGFVLRFLGPDRAFSRAQASHRMVCNYLTVKPFDARRGFTRLAFTPTRGLEGFLIGMGEATFEALHPRPFTIEVEQREGDQLIALARWD